MEGRVGRGASAPDDDDAGARRFHDAPIRHRSIHRAACRAAAVARRGRRSALYSRSRPRRRETRLCRRHLGGSPTCPPPARVTPTAAAGVREQRHRRAKGGAFGCSPRSGARGSRGLGVGGDASEFGCARRELSQARARGRVCGVAGRRVDDRSRGDGDPPRPRIASPAAAWSSCLRTVSRTTARDRCWQRSSCESSTARSRRRRSRQPSLRRWRTAATRGATGLSLLGAGARLAPPPADLVARTAELDRAVAWFEESPEHRIIAISGMPAVGKSAFALTLAARLRDALPDGEVGIELRGVDHPLRTEEIVTQVLSVFEQGESNPEDSPGRRRAIAEVSDTARDHPPR